MDQVGEQFLARAGLTFNQNGRLRVGDTQRELDCATDRRRLTDVAFLAVAFVQRAAQVDDLG